MLEDQTRRELLAKLGLGAVAVATAWPSRAAAQAQQCKPPRIHADRAHPITIQTASPGESFMFTVVGTAGGFEISNSQVVPALDPALLGVAKDRKSLVLGVSLGAAGATIVGLDSILAGAKPGRCIVKGLSDGTFLKL